MDRDHTNSTPPQTTLNLKIAQINLNKSKPASLHLQQIAVERKWDILLIQEPNTYGDRLTNLPNMRLCSIGDKPRTAIAINNSSLSVYFHQNLSNRDQTVVTISTQNESITFVSAYHSGKPRHNSSNEFNITKLSEVLTNITSNKICFGIDSNAYSPSWGSEDEDSRGEQLSQFIASEDLIILNDGDTPTYHHQTQMSESFIDITVVSSELVNRTNNWSVSEEVSLSDHRYITFEISLTSAPTDIRVHSKRFAIHRADWEAFETEICAFKPYFRHLIDSSNTLEQIETTTETYMSAIKTITEHNIPFAKPNNRPNKWWNNDLSRRRTNVRYLRNRLRGQPIDFEFRKQEYLNAYHEYKTAIKVAKYESFRQFCTIDDNSDPWSSIYRILKTKKQVSAPLKPLQRTDGTYTATETETMTLLLEKYFPEDSPTNDSPIEMNARQQLKDNIDPESVDDLQFSESEVMKVIFRMKTKKSPGYDRITAPILKQICAYLLPELTLLFNKCLAIGCFPKPFKKAIIKFIPKPHSEKITTAKAFRPICLLPTIGKALDSLMIRRIQWFLHTTNKMSEKQYGFTPQKSTTDAILNVTKTISEYRRRGWCVFAISLDIEGAFDSAKWHLVLSALREKNCPKNLYKLAKHYFSDRSVVAETEANSLSRNASQGCMQGSPSGPVFWNILYDSLLTQNYGEHVLVQAFADDFFAVVSGANMRTTVTRTTEMLNKVSEWSSSFNLRFNASKSTIVHIGRGSDLPPPDILLNGQQIPFQRQVRYLGVTIDHQLNFTAHIKEVCDKGQSAIERFARVARNDWGIGSRAMTVIWKQAIEPAITYAAPVWAEKASVLYNKKRLKTTQRKALLRATRAYRTVSHEALWTISATPPIFLRIEEITANYYIKLAQVPNQYHHNPFLLNSVDIRTIVPRIPFFSQQHPAIRTLESASTTPSINTAKKQIRNSLITEWNRLWTNSTKGRLTYKFLPDISVRLKNSFYSEHLLTQYLTGHGDFMAYLSRFTLRPNDKCLHCGETDDVPHRILSCSLFDQCREQFFQNINVVPNNNSDFSTYIKTSVNLIHFKTFIENIHRLANTIQQTPNPTISQT